MKTNTILNQRFSTSYESTCSIFTLHPYIDYLSYGRLIEGQLKKIKG